MPEIEIRPPTSADIPKLVDIDHDYVSDHVWQMEVQHETGQKPSDLRVEIIIPTIKITQISPGGISTFADRAYK